jgi:hypothetical protein
VNNCNQKRGEEEEQQQEQQQKKKKEEERNLLEKYFKIFLVAEKKDSRTY